MNYKKYYVWGMDNEQVTEQYIKLKFNSVKPMPFGYRTSCPFKYHEHDDSRPAFDITKEGQFICRKCGSSGNLITLAKHFGDYLPRIFK